MDPRDRADETLARARARGRFVVTPDSATSPMDAAATVRLPREVVTAADQDATRREQRPAPPQEYGWPVDDPATDELTAQLPPNPYQAQRAAGQFGPLGSRAAQPPR